MFSFVKISKTSIACTSMTINASIDIAYIDVNVSLFIFTTFIKFSYILSLYYFKVLFFIESSTSYVQCI